MNKKNPNFIINFFSVVTSVRVLPAPKVASSSPMSTVSTGYYMSVIIFIMAGFAGVAFFIIILLMCLKRRKRWKRQKRCENISHFRKVVQLSCTNVPQLQMCSVNNAPGTRIIFLTSSILSYLMNCAGHRKSFFLKTREEGVGSKIA